MNSLFFPSIAFLMGIGVGDVWGIAGQWIVALLTIIVWIFFRYRCRTFFPVLFFLVLGFIYSVWTLHHFETLRTDIGTRVGWDGHDRTISGQAQELLSVTEFSRKYRVSVSHIDDSDIEPFDISLSLAPNLSLMPGDSITALGRFSFPRDTAEYMAEKQLWHRRIIAEFRSFHLSKTSPERYTYFVRMRTWFDQQLSVLFPATGHDILSGIILGQKTNIDAHLKEQLKASGLMHIMVVSGSNVMMLIIFLSLFLRGIHPLLRMVIITGVIVGFVILVGGDVPVWRAALMGIIGYSAGLWGYRFSPLLLPLLVAVVLSLIQPLSLIYDIGLQLSFLSVICIIAFGKKLTRFFGFLGPFFDEAFSLTIAATIGTFPITLFYFGTVSLISPLANLLAAPAIPVLMYGGIGTLVLSSFTDLGAYLIGYIPWFAVTYLIKIITLFGDQTWSLIFLDIDAYRPQFMVLSLGVLLMIIIRSTYSSHRKTSLQ